jgi:hypothetical protein
MHARSPDIIEYILIIYDKNAWCDQFKVVYCSPQKILPDTSIHQTRVVTDLSSSKANVSEQTSLTKAEASMNEQVHLLFRQHQDQTFLVVCKV